MLVRALVLTRIVIILCYVGPEIHSLFAVCVLFLKMAKVCAIFGGSRGIGKAVAELLAQRGCRLAIIARNLEVAQTTARNLGGKYAALQCFLRCLMLR